MRNSEAGPGVLIGGSLWGSGVTVALMMVAMLALSAPNAFAGKAYGWGANDCYTVYLSKRWWVGLRLPLGSEITSGTKVHLNPELDKGAGHKNPAPF